MSTPAQGKGSTLPEATPPPPANPPPPSEATGPGAGRLLFFVKTPAGNSAFCNLCMGELFARQRLFNGVPEEEGGPLLLTQTSGWRFARPGDLMASCDACDSPARLKKEEIAKAATVERSRAQEGGAQ